ncbi:glycogen debranching N-terminal domain-containing protein [Terrabacter aerolatus]|uniref:Amylo-alpha-1,6-glucosidase n=1 Tax=Terrabacter aerolatus TaxID=422442 RepID=A0A512CY29_9MICO|nr:glycogen debranching N-terminal domain-containing protein [Terrabacter aerolatus]GEO29122.1 amylo-alpha-1,6-glucosidase [Terrabacter aerolatus]
MTEGWAYTGGPPASGSVATVAVVEGRSFCVSGPSGDIGTSGGHGLVVKDTRFLDHLELRVDGEPLEPLTVEHIGPHAATFVTRRRPRPGLADSTLLVVRRRYVGNGMVEDVTLENLSNAEADVTLTLTAATDFASLFDVKEGRIGRGDGRIEVTTDDTTLRRRLDRPDSRAVELSATGGCQVFRHGLVWRLSVPARSRTTFTVRVVPVFRDVPLPSPYRTGVSRRESHPALEHRRWRERSPVVAAADPRLDRLVRASTDDLSGLRITDPQHPRRIVLAAGAPWFMTLFGRDSLLTAWMLLPLDARVARGTLETLAQAQGRTVDPLTEEEPGRILHEIRSGLLDEASEGEETVYYGTVDATPLFVMLAGELHRWGASKAESASLAPHVRRALAWIERYGDADGDGFVEYERATDRGLVNQGWKDSFDGITYDSGAIAAPPLALAEVQGYVYAALLAGAELARAGHDDDRAHDLEERAATLKRRFNESFWLPGRGYYAMALDAHKRPVDALGSNMGHCLWTGIVDDEHAASVAASLMSREMFTGFGIRTLSSAAGAYNPMSYHNGSVWPHDNAIIAAGLRRYGFVAEANRVVLGLLDAAAGFGDRLPELFCGFDRHEFARPVPYPTSCSPQAWAAAAPLLLVRSLLGLEVDLPRGVVRLDPRLPDRLLPISIGQLHVGGDLLRVSVDLSGWQVSGLTDGLRVDRGPGGSGPPRPAE